MSDILDRPDTRTDPGTAPDHSIISRATSLVPLIRESAEESSKQGRVVPEVIEALAEAGMYGQLVPTRLGGQGTNMRTLMESVAEIARGDGSTGWAVALSNAATWILGNFPDEAQREIFTKPNLKSCVVLVPAQSAKRVDGGYVVSGRWPYSSGSFVADWASFALPLEGGGVGMATVPVGDFTIEPSWDVIGMKGSGSDTVVVDEVFIPDHRICDLADVYASKYPTSHTAEQTARMTFLPAWGLPLIAVQVGLARHAREISLERVPKRSVAYTAYTQARNSPTHQVAVAEAIQRFDLAELLLQRASLALDETAEKGIPMAELDIARTVMDWGTISELVHEGMDRLMNANGSSAFTESSALGRVWRDSEIAHRHILMMPSLSKETYGKALLGAESATWG